MSTNTIAKAHKEALNDAAKDLMDPSVFLGVTVYGGSSYSFQGSNYGYTSGGRTSPGTFYNIIDKFPFVSDANATDVGDISVTRYWSAGQSSSQNGYTSGGRSFPGPVTHNVIDKFPFVSDGNASDVGDLTVARYSPCGQSSSENGYTSGSSSPLSDVIDKFPFASDANATDVGDLIYPGGEAAGCSSTTNGYTCGRDNPSPAYPGASNIIDKFSFASDGNAVDVGNFAVNFRKEVAGQSSTENAYISGGSYIPTPASATKRIDKFPFASETTASFMGELTLGRYYAAGQSSTASGYTSGGDPDTNVIDKFPFASDANATDVGDLTAGRYGPTGQQY